MATPSSAAQRHEAAYPAELRDREAELIARRRKIFGRSPPPPDQRTEGTVGLALSGGGIRSATFSLGVLQALARLRLLDRVDFLSTVSGGGYIGSFWGAWLSRCASNGRKNPPAGSPTEDGKNTAARESFKDAEARLADSSSNEVRWLRENGRYLSPNGTGDLMVGFAVHLRNWISIHVVLGSLVLAGALLVILVPDLLRMTRWFSWLPTDESRTWFGSGWYGLGVLPAVGVAVVLGVGYWIPGLNRSAVYRNRISRMLATALVFTGALLLIAIIDSLGREIYFTLQRYSPGQIVAFLSAPGSVALAILATGQKLLSLLTARKGEERLSLPMGVLAGTAAFVLAIMALVFWSTVAYFVARSRDSFLEMPFTLGATVLALIAALVLGRGYSFINFSSLATVYTARLSRAYLGGTNPNRHGQENQRVTESVPGDDIAHADYVPHDIGGPLHLINVTLNEVVRESRRIEFRDSKGVPVAVGPAGITVGIRHHARWSRAKDDGPVLCGINASPARFHCLAATGGGEPIPPTQAEAMTLGRWVSISGAAFTTGLGTRTSTGLSFLLGFFNVRLGHWWDSGVDPDKRPTARTTTLRGSLARWSARVFPTQCLLLDESLGRFRGPSRQRWYLSDGGHFENTAAYELIRRRTRLIVICDDGCDPGYSFDDLGHLARKARIDFQAEIRPLEETEIRTLLHADLQSIVGTARDLVPDPTTGFSRKCATLFWVYYDGSDEPGSLILALKPTLTGSEPLDLLNYRSQNPAYPQQTTMDQFFDEAQWESYRKLGEWIGEHVFAAAGNDHFFGGISDFP